MFLSPIPNFLIKKYIYFLWHTIFYIFYLSKYPRLSVGFKYKIVKCLKLVMLVSILPAFPSWKSKVFNIYLIINWKLISRNKKIPPSGSDVEHDIISVSDDRGWSGLNTPRELQTVGQQSFIFAYKQALEKRFFWKIWETFVTELIVLGDVCIIGLPLYYLWFLSAIH